MMGGNVHVLADAKAIQEARFAYGARLAFVLETKTLERLDVEPVDGTVLLHSAWDVTRMTPDEARTLASCLTQAASEAERLTPS